tara:strand:+ start:158 stop:1612 length:1455 start_codon:yes stop_codon:yes gene_type:complete
MTMGKKNLEQLFKENFRDFQEVPDQKVWASIETSLNNKKRKKQGIPIWWSLGGIAAALAVLLMLINPFAEEPKEEHIISDTEKIGLPDEPNNSIEKNNSDFIRSSTASEKQESLANISDGESLEQNNYQVTSNSSDEKNTKEITEKVAYASKMGGLVEKNKSSTQSKTFPAEVGGSLIDNKTITTNNDTNKLIKDGIITEATKNTKKIASNEESKDEVEKQSIYDAIEEQELLEEVVSENKAGKWSVGPSLAPVYFDASGDGSPIGPDFSSNSKSGNLNLSYGLTVAYEVGKKLRIRSGVHRVNYGYSTNDVVFSSTLRAASNNRIANIDYSQNSESIIVQSKDNAIKSPAISSKEIAFNEAPSLNGKMVQQLGYIEVPLEINYAVLDKKFGVALIGGLSSLFLVDNSVLLESNNLVTEIGEANNINSLNFSANVGMGLNYHFSPKIRINVEPVLKYQLNTFSNVSGNFQPYSIGVYSGFSFRF